MKKVVVLTGAGISAESGLATFRDSGGLWEGHDVYSVASPQGWAKNPGLVLEFYRLRYEQLAQVVPNAAHFALANLERGYEVKIVTQNVDDLHERGGSTSIFHLHGELKYVRSSRTHAHRRHQEGAYIRLGDNAPDGAQYRPDIVWFGEEVPLIEQAINLASEADILLIVGTSLVVQPAASLVHYVPITCKIYVVDPNLELGLVPENAIHLPYTAVAAVPLLVERLLVEVSTYPST